MTEATHRAIGVFRDRTTAETALTQLREAGFPLEKVSVLAKDLTSEATAEVVQQQHLDQWEPIEGDRASTGNPLQEGTIPGAITGGALGGFAGLLMGLGTLAVPGFGALAVGGAAVTAFGTALGTAAGGAIIGGIIGSFANSEVPKHQVGIYQDWLTQGGYVVMIDGSDSEIAQAETVLRDRGIQDWNIFSATAPTRVNS